MVVPGLEIRPTHPKGASLGNKCVDKHVDIRQVTWKSNQVQVIGSTQEELGRPIVIYPNNYWPRGPQPPDKSFTLYETTLFEA